MSSKVVANLPHIGKNGGTKGRTKGLTQAVERQAIWLKKTFKMEVELRFSKDGGSGGAFLVGHGIGLCAGLMPDGPRPIKLRVLRERGRRIFHAIYLDKTLIRPSKLRYAGLKKNRYAFSYCFSVKESRSRLLQQLDRAAMNGR